MDKQPLNTGEQKDMTEFFTDLITKMEEMSQELVKELWDNRSPQTHQAEDGGTFLVHLGHLNNQMFVCCRRTR